MLATVLRAALIHGPLGYLFALIVSEMLGALLPVMRAAPASDAKSQFVGAAEVMQGQFLLLALIGIVLTVIARGAVEGSLGVS